jgi:hypothetical protein
MQSLPFTKVAHQITSTDCQPTSGDGVLVFVCGNLKVSCTRLHSAQTSKMTLARFCCPVVGRHARAARGEFAGGEMERNLVVSGALFGRLCWASGVGFAS